MSSSRTKTKEQRINNREWVMLVSSIVMPVCDCESHLQCQLRLTLGFSQQAENLGRSGTERRRWKKGRDSPA
jgi:hypothetical protein